MQGVDEEHEAKSRSGEDLVNRPLPNFKHKKYLRSKFEEAMMIEANSSLLRPKKLDKVNNTSEAVTQPPLPPNPPPPDTPPMIMNVKQEIVDDEYTCATNDTSSDLEHSDELKAAAATIKTDQSEEEPRATMCRDFARGTCKKGGACRFKHELILSQLPGVYTFCRNFQNSVCSFPKCKFVHATVFEKEYFFRTGYLPPHTLAHLKETSVQQAPPPPPQTEDASAGLPPVYTNTAPTPSMPCVPPAVGQYNLETCSEQSDPIIFNNLQAPTNTTSPKREWREIDEASSTSRDRDSSDLPAKKCKFCDSNELREQLMKAKVEKCIRGNKELIQKIAQLNKKNSLRASLFRVFLKPANTPSAANGLQITAEKDLNSLLSNDNNNWTSVLAKMLRNLDSVLPPDAS